MLYSLSVANDRLQRVANAIDAGSSAGVLRLLDAGNSILSSISLSKPCGTVSNAVLSFSGLSRIDQAAASGTVAAARIEDYSGNTVVSGLIVGAPGSVSDVYFVNRLGTTAIIAGQTVALTTATITSVYGSSIAPTPPVTESDLLLADAISFLLLVTGDYLELAA